MDPNATLDIILDDTADRVERLDAIEDLTIWLERGGYTPRLRRLNAPTFGGNTAARQWAIRKLEALRTELLSESVTP